MDSVAAIAGSGEAPDPPQFITSVTPSGIEVGYCPDPRGYRLRRQNWGRENNPVTGLPDEPSSWIDVPSVTTVLDVLHKPLSWWAQGVTVDGVRQLIDHWSTNDPTYLSYLIDEATSDEWIEQLKTFKLTVNHVRDRAGDRGTAVHDAFEHWAKTGELPVPEMYPPEEQLYVVGLKNFLKDVNPEPLDSEVMVGSLEHGYAGRYDIRIRIPEDCKVVKHITPVKGPQWAMLRKGVILADLKTSSDVYNSHSRQVEAYELASLECGYEPTNARGILAVGYQPKGDNGRVAVPPFYKFVPSCATADDFLQTLELYKSEQRMEKRRKELAKL